MANIDELYSAVAYHLAGAPVKVRWRNPVTSNAVAEAYKTAGGYMIDIGVTDPIETAIKLYLHELAHCRLGHPVEIVSGNEAPGSMRQNDAERATWREDPRERAAKELAEVWYDYAKKNAWRYRDGITWPIEPVLRALLIWQPPGAKNAPTVRRTASGLTKVEHKEVR